MADANFEGAALGHVNFEYAKLQRANFSGADLSSADLAGADLTGADLTGANTSGADFNSADAQGRPRVPTALTPGGRRGQKLGNDNALAQHARRIPTAAARRRRGNAAHRDMVIVIERAH